MDVKEMAGILMRKAGFSNFNVIDPKGTVEALRAMGVTEDDVPGPNWWKKAKIHHNDGTVTDAIINRK